MQIAIFSFLASGLKSGWTFVKTIVYTYYRIIKLCFYRFALEGFFYNVNYLKGFQKIIKLSN